MTASPPAYALDDASLLRQCEVSTSTSGGPGGQHANKTASAVRISHRATGAVAQCHDHRDRLRNQQDALHRLRIRIAAATRGASDPAWLEPYRNGRQIALGANAREFHLVAAAALDALAAAAGSLADAAAALRLSTTQYARLLTADADIRAAADAIRAANGLSAVRP
ncbi:MAG TPA: peptide chain release factor-like protein [Planctomycetota bacterium]|nr:peptide chain release factor-like protein [Planctomycetota bacterium]